MKNDMDNLGYLLNKATRLMKWDLTEKLDKFELTPAQWSVIKDLHINESMGIQFSTPATVAERLNIDRPTISGIMNRLAQKGWIDILNNPEDRRSNIIKLTDKSVTVIDRIEKLCDDTMEKALVDFNKKEIEELKTFMNKIIKNLT